MGIRPQIAQLKRGVDILVATPGRLPDHHRQSNVDFSHVEVLVLDEADRMLDMGLIRDIKRVLALLPKRRQNLPFSATFPDEIKALADSLLNRPATIELVLAVAVDRVPISEVARVCQQSLGTRLRLTSQPITTQQDVDAQIAEARPIQCQLAASNAQRRLILCVDAPISGPAPQQREPARLLHSRREALANPVRKRAEAGRLQIFVAAPLAECDDRDPPRRA